MEDRADLIGLGLYVVLYFEAGLITKEVYDFRINELLNKGVTKEELLIK